MNRRAFIVTAAGLLTALPAAEAQHPARLGMLLTGSPAGPDGVIDAFLRRLAELGWVEGRTLGVERRWAEHPGQFSALAAELVGQKVNVILTPGGQATTAAKAATSSIPIVMIASTDPVAAGLAASLAQPGGNLTGVTVAQPELMAGKRLEILTQAVPGLRQVAVLWDASVNPPSPESIAGVNTEARRLGLRLHHTTVRSAAEFEDAFRSARAGGAGAVLAMESPLFTVNALLVAERAVKHRLPVMTLFSRMVERGVLISYGPNLTDLFLRAAAQVDKILRGASPASLPIEQPSTFALVINLKTAKALGLTIPPSLLLRADHVIE